MSDNEAEHFARAWEGLDTFLAATDELREFRGEPDKPDGGKAWDTYCKQQFGLTARQIRWVKERSTKGPSA